MPLTSCSECGGRISTKSATCPHCGAPESHQKKHLDTHDSQQGYMGLVLVSITCLGIVACFSIPAFSGAFSAFTGDVTYDNGHIGIKFFSLFLILAVLFVPPIGGWILYIRHWVRKRRRAYA